MKTLIKNSVLVALLFFLVATVNGQQKIDKSFSGIKKIKMNTSSGDCIIKKALGSEVNVKLTHTYESGYEPSIEQEGSRLVIKENFDKGSWSGSAKWTLTLPDDIDVSFSTGSGDFEASDLKMELDMNTGSGDIDLVNVKGDFRTNTGSGSVSLSGFDGELKANTGSGDMDVRNIKGDISLNCGSGDIDLKNVTADISANVGSGDIEAEALTLTGSSSFNSGSGDVSVTLSKPLDHSLSVNSGSGDAKVDFNGNKIEGTVIMSANKKNGKISAPFKFDKEEEIDQGGGKNNIKIVKTAQLGSKDIKIKIGTGSGTASISK